MSKDQKTYRLEFSEAQQHLRLDNYSHIENTCGWVTILRKCTDDEFKIIEAYVNRTNREKLTAGYLTESIRELLGFIANLKEYNIEITKILNSKSK